VGRGWGEEVRWRPAKWFSSVVQVKLQQKKKNPLCALRVYALKGDI